MFEVPTDCEREWMSRSGERTRIAITSAANTVRAGRRLEFYREWDRGVCVGQGLGGVVAPQESVRVFVSKLLPTMPTANGVQHATDDGIDYSDIEAK